MQLDNENVKIYTIGAFAKLTGVTERTLRYYDRQKLLKPSGRNAQGHRLYTEQDLQQLQKILTLKYLDFSLEDIGTYLSGPEHDLQQSLAAQYEMLKQKQQQLQRVLDTIERMQNIVEGAGKVDRDLLLMFIHNIQHEEVQKEWLAQQMPQAVVNGIFLEGLPDEEKLELEKRMTAILIQLKLHMKQGKQPLDPEVIESAQGLLDLLKPIINSIVSKLDEQEIAQFEALEDSPIDPVLFPNSFTKEEEAFLSEVFAHLDAQQHMSGGEADGG